jgi:competence ComEA-like helix-hairpin-helix protein
MQNIDASSNLHCATLKIVRSCGARGGVVHNANRHRSGLVFALCLTAKSLFCRKPGRIDSSFFSIAWSAVMLKKLLMLCFALMLSVGTAFAAVDVNTADQAALDSVKGLGPVKSKAIVDERAKNGPFKDADDLATRVKGLGTKSVAKLEENGLTIGGSSQPPTGKTTKPAVSSTQGAAPSNSTVKSSTAATAATSPAATTAQTPAATPQAPATAAPASATKKSSRKSKAASAAAAASAAPAATTAPAAASDAKPSKRKSKKDKAASAAAASQ